jgi:hypothetical protein
MKRVHPQKGLTTMAKKVALPRGVETHIFSTRESARSTSEIEEKDRESRDISSFDRVYLAEVKAETEKFKAAELAAIQRRPPTVKVVN